MTEVSFARSFLSTLDARPIKISADHVEDPRTYPARGPVSRLGLRWMIRYVRHCSQPIVVYNLVYASEDAQAHEQTRLVGARCKWLNPVGITACAWQ